MNKISHLTICHHISLDHIDGFVQESSNSIDMASNGQTELKWQCSSKDFFFHIHIMYKKFEQSHNYQVLVVFTLQTD